MKTQKSTIVFGLLLFLSFNIFAQNGWITDNEMQFKIKAPANYKQTQTRDGSDKVLSLLSPDENVLVRVRAMPANAQFNAEVLQRAFEQNMIQGANRIMNENGNLHGIPALTSAYTWKVDNNEAVLGIYYIVQNGFAYIIWTAIPRNLIQHRSAEADGIINSFELLQPAQAATGGGLLSGLGNIGNAGSSNIGTASSPTPPASPKVSNPDYLELVSDDACVEHLYPKALKCTSVEQGQSIWEGSNGVKMVVQTIFKQGTFRSFMDDHIRGIGDRGATVTKKQYQSRNGSEVLQYRYEYNGTLFAYLSIENNDLFYLMGFVGSVDFEGEIEEYANVALNSIKKVSCPSH